MTVTEGRFREEVRRFKLHCNLQFSPSLRLPTRHFTRYANIKCLWSALCNLELHTYKLIFGHLARRKQNTDLLLAYDERLSQEPVIYTSWSDTETFSFYGLSPASHLYRKAAEHQRRVWLDRGTFSEWQTARLSFHKLQFTLLIH